MNRNTIKRTTVSHKFQRGALLVEFVLVTPFVLFLLGYILRLTLQVQAQQIAMNLSREVATDIFRRCADFTILDNSTGTPTVRESESTLAIQNCLTNTRTRFINSWETIKPVGTADSSLSILLSVYRHGIGYLAACERCPCSGAGWNTTAINVGSGTQSPPSDDTLCQRNRVVRVSLSFRIQPLTSFLSLIGNATGLGAEVTIQEEALI